MGKPTANKKKQTKGKLSETSSKNSRSSDHQDMAIFIEMSQQLKDEGNKLFQKRDYQGAILKYEKSIKLLPKNHVDIAYLHSNIAACYMQMKPEEYHKAITECNLALEVLPKYSKALLKRARCFESLNRLDLAFKDVDSVLNLEPNNITALEISERVKKAMDENGIKFDDKEITVPPPETIVIKEKPKKKKSHRVESNRNVVKKEIEIKEEEQPMKPVKLVFGDDIRNAQMPAKCSMVQLKDTVRTKFPGLKSVLVKYKDREGDLVTITTSDELRLAEESAETQGSIRLFITESSPEQGLILDEGQNGNLSNTSSCENESVRQEEDWILEFARLFKNHVGLDSDSYLDLHDLGIKLYSEAMEETVTSDEAQEIFLLAETKYEEMVALAFFNWGNVHMSRARKMLYLPDNVTKESIVDLVKDAYEWARGEYVKAGERYAEGLRVKPDFYEGYLAIGQQKFEQAKLYWYYVIGSKLDLDSTEVLNLFNLAEESMERGMEIWEKTETKRLRELNKPDKEREILEKMRLGNFAKDISSDDAAELAANMRSQINILWGAMLYERSVVEFKLGFATWEECLMESVEKFKLSGASPTDIGVMVKNHCAYETAPEGLGFKIDEIIQAWNEMYEAKKWISGTPSFRLEPLFRRRSPKLHHLLEHLHYA